LVNAALIVVVPEMTGGAGQHIVAVAWIYQNLGDVFAVLETNVGPVLAAVSRFVNSVADGNTVAEPRLSGSHPHSFRVRGIDRDCANGLNVFAVENRFESRAAVHGLPNAAAGRSHEDSDAASLVDGIQCGDAAAHRGRPDIAGRQAGNGRSIEAVLLLSRNQRSTQRNSCENRHHWPEAASA
jgi:hypothetical protein